MDERPTVRLGDWEPPTQYNQPQLEPSGGIRTKEHQVLGDVTVVQELGEESETFRLRGDAFSNDLRELRELKGERVDIRHEVFSGQVLVTSVSGSPTGSWEDIAVDDPRYEPGKYDWTDSDAEFNQRFIDSEEFQERDMSAVRRKWVYNYTVELVKV